MMYETTVYTLHAIRVIGTTLGFLVRFSGRVCYQKHIGIHSQENQLYGISTLVGSLIEVYF